MSILLALAFAAHPSIDQPVRTGATAPDDFAVVIGIEDYAFLPDVPYALSDASAWADYLLYTRGVPSSRVVRLVGQPSRAQIRGVLEEAGEAGPDSTVFVVFAGHGAAHSATGEPMLMPAETPSDPAGFAASGLPLDDVQEMVGAGGARVVVITDTCYSGAGRDGEQLMVGARFAVPAWVTAPAGGGVTWRATAANELALPLDDVGHGAFTYAALRGLRGAADGERDGVPDGMVTGEEAQLYTQRVLRELGIESQQPQWDGPTDLVFVEAPGKLEQDVEPEEEDDDVTVVRAPTVDPLGFLRSAPRDLSQEVAAGPSPEPVTATAPPAKAVRASRAPSALERSIEVEAAFGSWTGVRVVHRWDGPIRRVGLESGVGVGYMEYLSCDAASCQRASNIGADIERRAAVLPYAHALALHLALSPATRGPWSRLDLAGSLGLGVSVHHRIGGAVVTGGYSVQGRWTPGKGGVWVAAGFAGVEGDWSVYDEQPYTWDPTFSLLACFGVRLGTVWRPGA